MPHEDSGGKLGSTPVGNRLAKIDSVEGTTTYLYDENDRLLEETGAPGTTTYGWDANGNQVAKSEPEGLTTYLYDPRNLLAQATVGTHVYGYQYDVDGARTAKILDGVRTNHLVDQNWTYAQVLRETDASGAEVAHHVFGREEILGSVRPSEGARHMLYDVQRSVRLLTAASGTVSDTYGFDAWGIVSGAPGPSRNQHQYLGESFEDVAELVYLRARYYDPNRGRFTAVDPDPGATSNPSTLHDFGYANNDPINNRDPNGEFFLSAMVVVNPTMSSVPAAAIRPAGDRLPSEELAIAYLAQGAALTMAVTMEATWQDSFRHWFGDGSAARRPELAERRRAIVGGNWRAVATGLHFQQTYRLGTESGEDDAQYCRPGNYAFVDAEIAPRSASHIYLCDLYTSLPKNVTSVVVDPESGSAASRASVILHEALHLYTGVVDVELSPTSPDEIHRWAQEGGAGVVNALNYEYQALFH